MDQQKRKRKRQLRRRLHVRRYLQGTPQRPRLSVFRSSKHIYAQLIDDLNGVTLAAASSRAKDVRSGLTYGGNIKAATLVGRQLAEAARAKGIDKAAFDRGHYRFHGRVKALAVAANAAGLKCCESKPGKKKKAKPEPVAAAAVSTKGKKEKKEKKEKQAEASPSAG
jgi:large subunit ribosomal protein L18